MSEFLDKEGLKEVLSLLKDYIDNLFIDTNGYEYVDMGEAGVWAKYPIGVTDWNEEALDKIKYFEWGGIEGYTASQVGADKQFSSSFTDYRFSNRGATSGNPQFNKYCGGKYVSNNGDSDKLDTLELEDDAAHVIMGGEWRMPTSDEVKKLYECCDVEFESSYDGYNGVPSLNGILFKLKSDKSKQLFFPFAGRADQGGISAFGEEVHLWTRSLDTTDIKEADSIFADVETLYESTYPWKRYCGLNIIGFLPTSVEKYLTKKEAKEIYKTGEEIKELITEELPVHKGEGEYSVSFNKDCKAKGIKSVAEGNRSEANGEASHAEGYGTRTYAVANYSHAEGYLTEAYGEASHAEGYQTNTFNRGEHACGLCNISSSRGDNNSEDDTIFSIGNGKIADIMMEIRHNAFEVKRSGEILISDIYSSEEYFDKPTFSLQKKLNSIPTCKYLTQEQYDSLDTKDPNTLYFITEE